LSFKLILYIYIYTHTHTHAHGFKESLKAAEQDYKLERSKRRQCMIGLDASHTGSIHLPNFHITSEHSKVREYRSYMWRVYNTQYYNFIQGRCVYIYIYKQNNTIIHIRLSIIQNDCDMFADWLFGCTPWMLFSFTFTSLWRPWGLPRYRITL
jgi:hypothetical protein